MLWTVGSTDLGIMWTTGPNEIAIAFGDTFSGTQKKGDWRHNLLAFSDDRDPSDGITLARMLEDRPGHAREFIHPTPGAARESLIPTGGVAIGDRQYVFFMSVPKFGGVPAGWRTNYSSIAFSDDHGATWTRSDARWSSDSRFAQVALVRDVGYLYVLGTPAGRTGALHLARVPEASVLDTAAYAYYDGNGFRAGGESIAAEIAPAPFGELSILRNAWFGPLAPDVPERAARENRHAHGRIAHGSVVGGDSARRPERSRAPRRVRRLPASVV